MYSSWKSLDTYLVVGLLLSYEALEKEKEKVNGKKNAFYADDQNSL